MSKRLGFKPSYIRSQRNFHYTNDGVGYGSFGTTNSYNKVIRPKRQFMKEGFDLVNATQTNKVYVCVDKETQKFALAYDEQDTNFTAPILAKPLDINDRSQWLMSNADSGIISFFYTPANHFNIEIVEDPDLGFIPVRRSDKFKNAFFTFGTNGEIISKIGSDDGVRYCLAFKKGDLKGADKSPSQQFEEWDKRYSFYKDDSKAEWKSSGEKEPATQEENKEGFWTSLWNSVNPFHKQTYTPRSYERFDSTTEAYIELTPLDGIDKEKYSYQWTWFEVWDVRTATNLALEAEQIKDLKQIDAKTIDESKSLIAVSQNQLDDIKKKYNNQTSLVKSHLLGRMWI